MYLFFDTETTGLPKNWRAPVTDTDNWPRLVQLAWLSYDKDGNKTGDGDLIVKPDGFIIPADASRVHGITTERAFAEGRPLREVLERFEEAIAEAESLVAHNIGFDEKVIGAELYRAEMPDLLSSKHKICTMEGSKEFCKLEGPYGYKWPRLSELHIKLFGDNFSEAHNARADIEATAKCFWELRQRGVL